MHIFGLLASCASLPEMDDIIDSAIVLFSSPCMGPNVNKHFNNLQQHMLKKGTFDIDKQITEEDYKVKLKIL
jgi:hypothetical protein